MTINAKIEAHIIFDEPFVMEFLKHCHRSCYRKVEHKDGTYDIIIYGNPETEITFHMSPEGILFGMFSSRLDEFEIAEAKYPLSP